MESVKRNLVAISLVVSSGRAFGNDEGRPIPGQMVVVTSPGVTAEALRAAHPGLSLVSLRHFTPGRIHLFAVPVGQEDAYEVELGGDTARVRVAEQNRTVAIPEQGTTQSLFLRVHQANLGSQQAFTDVNGPNARRPSGPAGPLVAVLDTGIAPHPDLAGRIAEGGYNFINDSAMADESACAIGSGMVGHGTYVAGLISLVNPAARLLPITVLDCNGVGDGFAAACGVYQAIDAGATVINMSFATTVASGLMETAVQDAAAAGIICVASVSNSGQSTNSVRVFPAEFDEVIGVGAVQRSSGGVWSRAPFSDWHRSVDLAAPGVDIRSLWFDGAEFGYAQGSGTSYSAAWVSGASSIVMEKYGAGLPIPLNERVQWLQDHFCATANVVSIGMPYGMGCEHNADGIAAVLDAARAVCRGDFNADGFVDGFDYDAFVIAFEVGLASADVTTDGFIDGFDYDAFVEAYEHGCG